MSRKRASCAKTTESSIASSFSSEKTSPITSAWTSPTTSLSSDDELIEIDKREFEAGNKKRKRSLTTSSHRIIRGSTLGGTDPLHVFLKASGIEPTHWREERQRRVDDAKQDSRRDKRVKSKPPADYLKPDYYETLPFSPQDYFTSGLDLDLDPETSETFWAKLQERWKYSCLMESVTARRRRFGDIGAREEKHHAWCYRTSLEKRTDYGREHS